MAAITDPDPLQKTKRSEFQSTPRRHRASLRSSSMLEQAASFRKCGISYGSRSAEDSPGISLPVQGGLFQARRAKLRSHCPPSGTFRNRLWLPKPRTKDDQGVQQSNSGLSPFGDSPTGGLSPIVVSGGDGRQILNHRGLPLAKACLKG